MEFKHIPIMLEQVVDGLDIKHGGIYVDCTLGGAGHSFSILNKLDGSGRLIGIDKDEDALNASRERLKNFDNVVFVHDDYKNFSQILDSLNVEKVDGILIDLGVSSYQLDCGDRGFSFRTDFPLDMRMDRRQSFSAYDVVNGYSLERLAHVISEYGEERFAYQIAKNICTYREGKPIETTFELVKIIESSMPKKYVYSCGGASKKTFQAIRIEVNGELVNLEHSLKDMLSRLKRNGRICVLTFHSLEDRIVKNVFKIESTNCLCPPKMPICVCGHRASIELITRKPIEANEAERSENSRSSCAKLRIAKKII